MRSNTTSIIVYTVGAITIILAMYYAYRTRSQINTWSNYKRPFYVTDKELSKIERKQTFNDFNRNRVEAVKNYEERRNFDKKYPNNITLKPGKTMFGSLRTPRNKGQILDTIMNPTHTNNVVVDLKPNFNNEDNGFLGGLLHKKKYKKSKLKNRR